MDTLIVAYGYLATLPPSIGTNVTFRTSTTYNTYMWIKRTDYEAYVSDRASLRATETLVGRLEKEIDYWRQRYESERNRADRVVDAHFASGGIAPVTDLGVSALKEAQEEMKKFASRNDTTELASDGDDISVGDGEGHLRIDPELLQVLTGAGKGLNG